MPQFQAFDRRVELTGGHLIAIVQAFPQGTEKMGVALLKANGVEDPQTGSWYSLQAVLDVMKGLAQSFHPAMLTRMGYRVAQLVELPPQWNSIDVALKGLDAGYKMNHRGGEIGSYYSEELGIQGGLHRIKMIAKTHWPCEYDLGIFQGVGDRFKKEGMEVLVRKDDNATCRKNGADSCTYLVSWL